MSSKTLPQTNQEIAHRVTLGTLLRTTRVNRNSSLAEATSATRISQRILTALEADDFAALPAEVFTRGFIKLYAEYLGLDANEVLKLFTDQENLDPVRPADRPYRRDILFGTAMAHPLQIFKGNPRLRIVAMLVVALLTFYALGAIFKSLQKHPDQDAPENEVAKSLVNSVPPSLPGPPGVALVPLDGSANLVQSVNTPPPALPADASTTTGSDAASPQAQASGNAPAVASQPQTAASSSSRPAVAGGGNTHASTTESTAPAATAVAPSGAPAQATSSAALTR